MQPSGQSSASLSERLRKRMEEDQAAIERLMRSEVEKLALSLRSVCEAALSSTESAIRSRSTALVNQMSQIEARQRRLPLLIGAVTLVLSGSILLGLWAFTGWQRSELMSVQASLASERQALEQLQAQTGGIRFQVSEKGKFVVLPKGSEAGWTCDGAACIRLEP